MPIVKIHLEHAEYDAIERFASGLKVKPEAVAYCALNRLMLDARNPALRTEIAHTWDGHHSNLPLWSDSAGGPHGYEGKPDDEPVPSKYLRNLSAVFPPALLSGASCGKRFGVQC